MQARLRAAAEVAGETSELGGVVEENDATNFNRLKFYGLSRRRVNIDGGFKHFVLFASLPLKF